MTFSLSSVRYAHLQMSYLSLMETVTAVKTWGLRFGIIGVFQLEECARKFLMSVCVSSFFFVLDSPCKYARRKGFFFFRLLTSFLHLKTSSVLLEFDYEQWMVGFSTKIIDDDLPHQCVVVLLFLRSDSRFFF